MHRTLSFVIDFYTNVFGFPFTPSQTPVVLALQVRKTSSRRDVRPSDCWCCGSCSSLLAMYLHVKMAALVSNSCNACHQDPHVFCGISSSLRLLQGLQSSYFLSALFRSNFWTLSAAADSAECSAFSCKVRQHDSDLSISLTRRSNQNCSCFILLVAPMCSANFARHPTDIVLYSLS